MGENVSSNWKIAAIILAIGLLLETAGVVWLFKVGWDSMTKEEICANEICANDPNAVSFNYNSNTNYCSCYDINRETTKSEKVI